MLILQSNANVLEKWQLTKALQAVQADARARTLIKSLYIAAYSAQTVKKLPTNPKSANPRDFYTYYTRQKILHLIYGDNAEIKNGVRKFINNDISNIRDSYQKQRDIILNSLVADLDATIKKNTQVSKLLLHNLIYEKVEKIVSIKNMETTNRLTAAGFTPSQITNVERRAFVADIFKHCWVNLVSRYVDGVETNKIDNIVIKTEPDELDDLSELHNLDDYEDGFGELYNLDDYEDGFEDGFGELDNLDNAFESYSDVYEENTNEPNP